MPPSPDQAPSGMALIGKMGAGNIGTRNLSWSFSTGQHTDTQAWCFFGNRGREQRKGGRIQPQVLQGKTADSVSVLFQDKTLVKVFYLFK